MKKARGFDGFRCLRRGGQQFDLGATACGSSPLSGALATILPCGQPAAIAAAQLTGLAHHRSARYRHVVPSRKNLGNRLCLRRL